MSAKICYSLVLAVLAIACQKNQGEGSSKALSSSALAPTQTPAQGGGASRATDSAGADVDLPEDFSDDAKEQVTPANVAEQLRTLEEEIESSVRRQ
jgi:hypothetical protein